MANDILSWSNILLGTKLSKLQSLLLLLCSSFTVQCTCVCLLYWQRNPIGRVLPVLYTYMQQINNLCKINYIGRPEQLSFAGCNCGTRLQQTGLSEPYRGCSFNTHAGNLTKAGIIDICFFHNLESYGQVFIKINLLPALALNIGVPRSSYVFDFYPAIHFVDQYNIIIVIIIIIIIIIGMYIEIFIFQFIDSCLHLLC